MTVPDPRDQPATGEGWLDAEVTRRLFARRQLLLQGELTDERATRLAAELMTLEAEGPDPVILSVNSPGGDLPALFAVTDTLQAMHAPVDTRCLGQARGTAVALVAAGTGQRRAGRHAQLVLELPESHAAGSAVELDRAARAATDLVEQLVELMARATGRAREQVAADWRHGRVLSAGEACREGLLDEVGEPAGREAGAG